MGRSWCVWVAAAWLATGCAPSDAERTSRVTEAGGSVAAADAVAGRGFIGSKRCIECHGRFYELWSTSHHGKAMQTFNADLAATLAPQAEPIRVGEATYRADLSADPAVVESAKGVETRHPILHVMGGKNVYYFLTDLGRGKLQVLPVAYDVRDRRWYDTAMSGLRHFEEIRDDVRERAVHWRDREYTFNTSCHGCHVSQVATNYDLGSDSYRTTWNEPGINCETCHGPAAQHVAAMTDHPDAKPEDSRLFRMGDAATVAQNNAVCNSCHAKSQPLTPEFRLGDDFFNHYGLTLLESPDYYPDGRDLGENYTATSWLMSPCAKGGKLSCLHCHTSSGRYRFANGRENESCASCHKDVAAKSSEHSRHAAGTAGDRCNACHMPTTRFAAMSRSDHSMLPPTPAATVAYKSPNACNLCHKDRDAAWADAKVREWFPRRDFQAPVLERANLVEAARRRDWSKLGAIREYLSAPDREDVFAASLIRMLADAPAAAVRTSILSATRDPSPLVRAAAAEALRAHLDDQTAPSLLTAIRDPVRLVRLRAAEALAPWPLDRTPAGDRGAVAEALAEYEAALRARPDDPAAHSALGALRLNRGDADAAAAEYETALRLGPDEYPTLVDAATAFNVAGRNDRAVACLKRAADLEPQASAAHFNLGLLLAEAGRPEEAEASLRSALKVDPDLAAAAYNLAVLVAGRSPDEAIALCRRAAAARPDDPRYAYTAAFYLRSRGDLVASSQELQSLIDRSPGYADAYFLLGDVYEARRMFDDAAAVYRRAADRADLPAEARRAAAAKLGPRDR